MPNISLVCSDGEIVSEGFIPTEISDEDVVEDGDAKNSDTSTRGEIVTLLPDFTTAAGQLQFLKLIEALATDLQEAVRKDCKDKLDS